MKYIFKQIDDISGHDAETTVEFSADTISSVLEHFEMFLRGSGFITTGVLDFVLEDDSEIELEEPQEEVHEWTRTLREDAEAGWPFPRQRPVEGDTVPWQGVAPSVAMQWTVNQLMKEKSVCPICKIDFETMANHECWDVNCPKGKDAD